MNLVIKLAHQRSDDMVFDAAMNCAALLRAKLLDKIEEKKRSEPMKGVLLLYDNASCATPRFRSLQLRLWFYWTSLRIAQSRPGSRRLLFV